MPDRVTTSFIPKESLIAERGPRPQKRSSFAFINLIAGFVLVASVLISGGMFLFKTYTVSSIQSKRDSLEKQRAAFEPATIEELARLDRRLLAAEKLLKSHVALSILFTDLEARTGTNLRFKTFKYEPAGSGRTAIQMSGTAKSFNSVALQSEAFGKSVILKDPIFSNLNLDQSGNVVFDFTAFIDPARVSYAASIVDSGTPITPITPITP